MAEGDARSALEDGAGADIQMDMERPTPLLVRRDVESFTAQGRWDGKEWVVTVDDPPHFGAVRAAGHSRTEARDGISDVLALLLGHRDFTVQVSFEEEIRG
jgi:predicted RNase H-like HicB family nuclease